MEHNLSLIWEKVLSDMKKEVPRASFFTLFGNSRLLSLENQTATVAVPSTTIIDLLQKRFAQNIKKYLGKHTGKEVSLMFVPKAAPMQKFEEEKAGPLFEQKVAVAPIVVGHLPRVRPDFTFENFAVSGSNQLAFVSSTTVAANPGQSYNPFFIYGPVGVGKTHLMHAIANAIYQKTPDKKIIYITSEEFTNEVVEAIRNNDTARMKKRFRSSHLLLIDDIQFIEGKERVQEELFHTFNILIDQGSQICLSSDRPPHEIKKLEKRLSSRFAGGLTVDIAPPDFELKTAILLIKAKKYGHELPIDIAKFIAEWATDTRSLEGLLLRVITQATTSGDELSLDLAKQSLGNISQEKKTHVHSEDIVTAVCDFYKIKPTQLKGPKRDAGFVRARQIAMYLLKIQLGLTLVEIGNILGGRDHTTVIHGVEKVQKLISNGSQLSLDISGITQSIHG